MSPSEAGDRRRLLLRSARLYLVVTESACRGPWLDAAAKAILSGAVDVAQMREKDMNDDAFVARAQALASLTQRAGCLLILNDRAHLVSAAGADGVHVGEEDVSPEEARRIVGDDLLVGLSTHDAAEVRAAPARGADYAGLGPCFETATKRLARRPRGPDLVRECCPGAPLPVFPIGGISIENLPSLLAAGATRAAVSAGVLSSDDPAAAALALAALLRGLD